ncbi:MAG: tol-pal system-associated acyl-CoA thioesterase [Chitinispirillales bacterium]|nr:tol-pal system-associated acyl-CoA thioesterase [Chitinispirillales bacterium]
MKKSNELRIRVYYEDTDCGNVVYYANYLRYMERGRTELLRELGVDFSSYHEKDTVFSVIEANVKYKQPARYNDLLTVVTNIKEVSGASLIFETQVRRGETLLVYGEVKLACVKLSTGMPKRIPGEIVSALKS